MVTDRHLQGLYAITREHYDSDQQLTTEVSAALRGGVRILQYRDKSGDRPQRIRQASMLATLCADHNTALIINDDIALARSIGAQGVHLGRDDATIISAREQLGIDAIVGISCYNQPALAAEAAAAGASYVAFGSFNPSPTKPGAVRASLELLREWDHPNTPACAIGGITLDNAVDLVTAGAAMVAVISDLWSDDDIEAHARAYARLWL